MELLKTLKEQKLQITESYYQQVQQMQKYYERDNNAARVIQTFFRKQKQRTQFIESVKAFLKIQQNFRGYFARKRYKKKVQDEVNRRNLQYFSNQAKIIQKYYRGYYCRKYIHNFYARQQYLKQMKIKNETFQKELNELAEEEKIYMEKNKEAIARQEFNELAKNLHHLASTSIIPGVYNAPYTRSKPMAFDVPIEVHLKNTFKANYKWKPMNKDQVNEYRTKLKKQFLFI